MHGPFLKKLRYHLYYYISLLFYRLGIIEGIGPGKVLVGGEDIFISDEWAILCNDYKRLSTSLKNSWYVEFLKRFKDKIYLDDAEIKNTDYYRNALKCIEITGHYFECKNERDLLNHAKNYIKQYRSIKIGEELKQIEDTGYSKIKLPIVFKVYNSDKYEIFDGHHRLAINYLLNKKSKAIIIGKKKTYLQKLILSVKQTKHRRDLYQSFVAPEFDMSKWNVIRNCYDRFNMMKDFLINKKILDKNMKLIDLACSYGWFVNEFLKIGLDAYGIDRDKKALEVGWIVYNLDSNITKQVSIEDFINETNKQYDITLFLSVLHHYALNMEQISEKEILKLVDRITRKVLFMDTGQSHEKWFSKKLSLWNDEYIINLIKKNTSFKEVFILGKDDDNRSPYKGNYNRTLFACTK